VLLPGELVQLEEGERAELVCRTGLAYPAPSISWEADRKGVEPFLYT